MAVLLGVREYFSYPVGYYSATDICMCLGVVDEGALRATDESTGSRGFNKAEAVRVAILSRDSLHRDGSTSCSYWLLVAVCSYPFYASQWFEDLTRAASCATCCCG
eukprot:XP_001705682.1 Hypothetical protein GL50803_35816 [Giardia lamblia ATCC 50803]